MLDTLGELLELARKSYPPASKLMTRLRKDWVQVWGDRELAPRRDPVVRAPRGRTRPQSLADTGVDAAQAGADWGKFGAAARVAPRPGRALGE